MLDRNSRLWYIELVNNERRFMKKKTTKSDKKFDAEFQAAYEAYLRAEEERERRVSEWLREVLGDDDELDDSFLVELNEA